jgi:hypothetical protein
MKTYLFEIYEQGFDVGQSVYQEVTASTYEDAKAKLLTEWANAYILNVYTQYYGDI